MTARSNSRRRISTGLFEIDLESGEVLKQGRNIPVQYQPFRVLAVLLERPGILVTRDELRTRLWPADTFVGFDEGLNTAIRKLRVLFGDSADNPRFIETLPRRGYRFIAPVAECLESDSLPSPGREVDGHGASAAAEEGAFPKSEDEKAKASAAPVSSSAGRRKILKWATVSATAIVLALILWKQFPKAPPVSDRVGVSRAMLAVLPFQNLTNDPEQEYFSDGLTEETITDLGELSPAQLGVIARTSVMTYKRTDKTIAQIGRELGVDFILEGSVRRENGRARISAQLIRVSDQTHLWAQAYEAETANDLLDVQNEIGRAIAERVQTEVTPQRKLEMLRAHSVNPEAYDLYLKGRFYWNQRTPASIRESIRLFKQATAADPNFAPAYAGLADAYNIGNIVGIYSAKESLPEATKAATRAIELDPSLSQAHAALGMAKSHFDFDFPEAKSEFMQAIELNPNSAYAHFFYSNCYLMPMALRAEAIAENKKAIELDPLSLPINNFMGETYLLAGDYAASERQFRHTMEMDPNFPLPHAYIAGLFEITGRFEEAIDEREKGDRLNGWDAKKVVERSVELRKALKNAGEKGYWKERLAQDLDASGNPGRGASASDLAQDYAQAGEKEKAFKWLEKSFEGHEGGELTLLAVDPVWRNLHNDPRFPKLLHQIGLPEL